MPASGKIGNKGNTKAKGGSRKAPAMKEFYKKLDVACLDAVSYLHSIIIAARRRGALPGFSGSEWRKDGISAAGKLIMKAPQRLANGDGSNLDGPGIYLPNQNHDVETT